MKWLVFNAETGPGAAEHPRGHPRKSGRESEGVAGRRPCKPGRRRGNIRPRHLFGKKGILAAAQKWCGEHRGPKAAHSTKIMEVECDYW